RLLMIKLVKVVFLRFIGAHHRDLAWTETGIEQPTHRLACIVDCIKNTNFKRSIVGFFFDRACHRFPYCSRFVADHHCGTSRASLPAGKKSMSANLQAFSAKMQAIDPACNLL